MCGLYGLVNYSGNKQKKLSDLTNALAEQSAVRGIDATGIAFCDSSGINILKESKSAYNLDFKHSDEICSLTGHTRHSTQGSEKRNYNNHPFPGKCKNSNFALSHNGVLTNDKKLRKKFKLPKTKIETDSYIAVQLIESQKKLDFDSIKFMAEKTEGSFSYTILDDKNNIWLVKGESPLSILHFPKQKMYVYASTDEILYKALVDYPPLFTALKKSRSNDNPYILLLFDTENMEWVDYRESAEKIYDELMAYQSMYSNEMSKIHEIVTKTIPKLSANDYKEVQITVGLDNFAVPILSASADASYYKRALYHINLIL